MLTSAKSAEVLNYFFLLELIGLAFCIILRLAFLIAFLSLPLAFLGARISVVSGGGTIWCG
jgi:hypothetical protein